MTDHRPEERPNMDDRVKGIQVTEEQLNTVASEDQVKQRKILKVARNKPAAAPAAAAPAAAAPAAPAAGGWSFLASASAAKADDDAKEDRPKPLFSFASLAKDKTGGGLGPFGAAAGAAPPVFTFKTNKLTEDGGDGNSDNDNGDNDNDDDKNDSNKDGAAAKTPASPKGGKNSGISGEAPASGEEGDELVLTAKAKIYAFEGGNWRECGLGDTRISYSPALNHARVIARVAGSKRLILNALLLREPKPEMAGAKTVRIQALSVMPKSDADDKKEAKKADDTNEDAKDSDAKDSDVKDSDAKDSDAKDSDAKDSDGNKADGAKGDKDKSKEAKVEAGSFLVRVGDAAEAQEVFKAMNSVLAKCAKGDDKAAKPPKDE